LEFGLRLSRGLRGANDWIADAHRGDGKRYVVRADEELSAFPVGRIFLTKSLSAASGDFRLLHVCNYVSPNTLLIREVIINMPKNGRRSGQRLL